jgi:diguanylate cyclase (GGDEF)-like protein
MNNAPQYTKSYDEFLRENRVTVNKYLNVVLWFCIFTGPAIALGVAAGIFRNVDYDICIQISVIVAILAFGHYLLLKKWPDSEVTSITALLAFNLLLAYMTYGRVAVYLTWFLVPLLSLLFCDTRIYIFSVIANYCLMILSTWLVSPYFSGMRTDYDTVLAYFLNAIGGYTIETIIMTFAGLSLGRLATGYFRDTMVKQEDLLEHESQMLEQIDILDSMAEIYEKVNLIDFYKMTERPLRGDNDDDKLHEKNLDFSVSDHTYMTRQIIGNIVDDQAEEFIDFTNITTVQDRLEDKKIISGEFINKYSGWFRAQYIVAEKGTDGRAMVVVFTIQSIEAEKRREEHLIRIAMTDELTRLYNRRCYEEDILEYKDKEIEEDFSVFSIDVNGLKTANDTKGHVAGDELIKACSDCLLMAVGTRGKVYRTGGDEFIAIVHTGDSEGLLKDMKNAAASWHGKYQNVLTIAVGYAAHKDHPTLSVEDLEKVADRMMYSDKADYYRTAGIDRRKQ